MDDHFWPALYPGIIAGALVGLAAGGVLPTILGAAGGLLGAVGFYLAWGWLGLGDGILALAALILGAVTGAQALIMLGRRLRRGGSAGAAD